MERRYNQIRQGDCIAGMRALDAGAADLVFADPPFNIGYDYDVYRDSLERREYLAWSKEWIGEVHRILKATGAFWLAIGDEYAAELKITALDAGFHCRSWVIWYYTFGVNCSRKFSRSHAHLFHFVKDAANFTFREQDLSNRIPSARQLVYADSRANPLGRLPDDTWVLRPQDLSECFSPDEDTWYFPRVAGTFKERAGFHGCQMPEQLLGRIIRTTSCEGELVVDPFAGSASTLIVAKKLGRRFLGFELSKEYAERGTARIASVSLGDMLDGAPEPTVSAPATPTVRSNKRAPEIRRSAASAALSAAPADQTRVVNAQVERALLESFARTNDGYSLDRLVADPELNRRFVDECAAAGLFGDARSWNRLLFRLRKAGKLIGVVTSKRTSIDWHECDRYLFASEIALQRMLDLGHASLDDILCDPATAAEFDTIAAELAPGFSPLEYRWAALKLRKEAKAARERSAILAPLRLATAQPLADVASDVAAMPGLYVLQLGQGRSKLYVGESLDLRQRFQLHLEHRGWLLQSAKRRRADELMAVAVTKADAPSCLLAYQSQLVKKHKPSLNLKDLASVA